MDEVCSRRLSESDSQGVSYRVCIKSKYEVFSHKCLKYDGVELRTLISNQHYDMCLYYASLRGPGG